MIGGQHIFFNIDYMGSGVSQADGENVAATYIMLTHANKLRSLHPPTNLDFRLGLGDK